MMEDGEGGGAVGIGNLWMDGWMDSLSRHI